MDDARRPIDRARADEAQAVAQDTLVSWVVDITGRARTEIDVDRTLFELGVDSLDLVRIGRKVSRDLGSTMSFAELLGTDRSLAEIAIMIAERAAVARVTEAS